VELAARFAGDDDVATRANALAARLTELADEDSEAYTAFMAERSEETRRRIIDVPREIATSADEIERLADDVAGRVSRDVAGDAQAAAELARAASRVARGLVALNEGGGS
jgi:formiminotetrahydrofolate cyclodeaminase